eukprot:m.257792 g.257792  ORF g.257792 m.257792 type:complete len:105 (-) comp19184_c5_seq4:111-425(-)
METTGTLVLLLLMLMLMLLPLRLAWLAQDTMLKYYRHEAVQGETAVGYVNIDADTEITRSDPKSFLVVSSRRNLHLVAKTEFEATQWIEQLRLAVQVALDASMV